MIQFALTPMDLTDLARETSNIGRRTERRAPRQPDLQIQIPLNHVAKIADDLTGAFFIFVGGRADQKSEPTPVQTAKWAQDLVTVVDALLELLRADYRGEDETASPHVPIPNQLIDYPAYIPPEGFMSVNQLEDDARDTMLAQMSGRLNKQSVSGAHDVARAAVASLRQLRRLAQAKAESATNLQKRRTDWAAISLFRSLAEAFETLHGTRYTVTNTVTNPHAETQKIVRHSLPRGRAMNWTGLLLNLAADRALNTPLHECLNSFATEMRKKPDALAGRIREATHFKAKTLTKYSRKSKSVD